MKILYENSIPHGADYFSQLGSAQAFATGSLSATDLQDCDYLAVRSTTVVNETLLIQAPRLKMVATATAGTNHMDIEYLNQCGLAWQDAGGCNAVAVAEYVVSVLLNSYLHRQLDLSRITVGIIGAGHVGTALSRLLHALNISYVLNDPLRQQAGDSRAFVDLDEALQCDVVSLHVPFTRSGSHATENLLNAGNLALLGEDQLLINACRGEVIEETALIQRLQQPDAPTVVLDVYMHEPAINQQVVDNIWLSTGHIAGHSIEGKLRGTQMVYDAFCAHANRPSELELEDFLAAPLPIDFTPEDPSVEALSYSQLSRLLLSIYDVREDDGLFRQMMAKSNQFAEFRKAYRVRREFNAYTLRLSGMVSEGILRQLTGLGFILETI